MSRIPPPFSVCFSAVIVSISAAKSFVITADSSTSSPVGCDSSVPGIVRGV